MRTEHSQEAARIHPHSALKIATVRFVKRKAPKVLVSAAGTRGFTAERQGVAEPLAVANAGPSIRRQYSTKTAVYPKKNAALPKTGGQHDGTLRHIAAVR